MYPVVFNNEYGWTLGINAIIAIVYNEVVCDGNRRGTCASDSTGIFGSLDDAVTYVRIGVVTTYGSYELR